MTLDNLHAATQTVVDPESLLSLTMLGKVKDPGYTREYLRGGWRDGGYNPRRYHALRRRHHRRLQPVALW